MTKKAMSLSERRKKVELKLGRSVFSTYLAKCYLRLCVTGRSNAVSVCDEDRFLISQMKYRLV